MPEVAETWSRNPSQRSGRYEQFIDQLVSGDIWTLKRGEDFEDKGFDDDGNKKPKAASVASRIRVLMNERGYGAVSVVVDEDTIQIQATTEKKKRRPKKDKSETNEATKDTNSKKESKSKSEGAQTENTPV